MGPAKCGKNPEPCPTLICTARGDPHFTPFDGQRYSYMGVGVHSLAKISTGGVDINAQNFQCDPGTTGLVSNNIAVGVKIGTEKFAVIGDRMYHNGLEHTQAYGATNLAAGVVVTKIQQTTSGVHLSPGTAWRIAHPSSGFELYSRKRKLSTGYLHNFRLWVNKEQESDWSGLCKGPPVGWGGEPCTDADAVFGTALLSELQTSCGLTVGLTGEGCSNSVTPPPPPPPPFTVPCSDPSSPALADAQAACSTVRTKCSSTKAGDYEEECVYDYCRMEEADRDGTVDDYADDCTTFTGDDKLMVVTRTNPALVFSPASPSSSPSPPSPSSSSSSPSPPSSSSSTPSSASPSTTPIVMGAALPAMRALVCCDWWDPVWITLLVTIIVTLVVLLVVLIVAVCCCFVRERTRHQQDPDQRKSKSYQKLSRSLSGSESGRKSDVVELSASVQKEEGP